MPNLTRSAARVAALTSVLVAAGLAAAAACAHAASYTVRDLGPLSSAGHQAAPFRLLDPGTLGGPQSYFEGPGIPISAHGALLGQADTGVRRTGGDNCLGGCIDPFVEHAFAYQHGRITDLGALPGADNSSAVWEINAYGVGAGSSENGTINPQTGTRAFSAVMFEHGRVIDLGALPGGHEGTAQDINDRGQVAGLSSNGTPDPFAGFFFPWTSQTRSFFWEHGTMTDIGTLGGPDAIENAMNQRGEIVGQSFTSSTANAATGVPTLDPFLWAHGRMHDLGSLGGTMGSANWINDAGEVVGASDLAGDAAQHPFLWAGRGMIDLGTFGGPGGSASFVNARGHVAGSADLPDGTHHGFLWRNGRLEDLRPVDDAPCSNGNSINAADAVVGNITDCRGTHLAAVLWHRGEAIDLNTLVAPSALHLTSAEYIDDHGDVAAEAELPSGDQRLVELAPSHRHQP